MDATTPLVPSREHNKTTGILLTFCATIIFVLVTCVLAFVKGQEQYKSGFVIVGAALLVLILPTGYLLNWVRKDDNIEDRVKYVAVFLAISLLFLCISIMIVAFEGVAPTCTTCPTCPTCNSCCPICPPSTCNLEEYVARKPPYCGTELPRACWNSANNTQYVYFGYNNASTTCMQRLASSCFDPTCVWP